jgi:hypothetical protein
MADEGFAQTRFGHIRKRPATVSEIEALQAQAAQKVADHHALEAYMRIFDPDIDLGELPIRRIPPMPPSEARWRASSSPRSGNTLED